MKPIYWVGIALGVLMITLIKLAAFRKLMAMRPPQEKQRGDLAE